MPGKKRPTSAKTSAISKRHKPASSKPKSSSSAPPKAARETNGGSFGPDKERKSSAKKDRKGKGLEFIPVVQAKEGDMSDSDGGMDVDDELDDEQAGFLTRLDEKGMSQSRPALAKAHRKEKPAAPARGSNLDGIPLLPTGMLKSELKALKKKERRAKKAAAAAEAGSDAEDLEQDEEDGPSKAHPDGELVSDLESDDLAFGSGSSDDDLSVMSEFESGEEMSDMSDMSDLDSELMGSYDSNEDLDSLDSEDEEDEEDSGDEEVKFDDDEELKWDSDAEGAADSDAEEDDDEDLDSEDDDDLSASDFTSEDEEEEDHKPRKKSRPAPEADDLEAAYESRPAPPKPAKTRPTKLPTIQNGQIIAAAPDSDDDMLAPSPSPTPEPEEPKKVQEYRSDPLGQRFGRPAVRQLLEIRDRKERISKAREEIADLGREASGTGEGEGGVNLLKRLLSLTAPKFAATNAGKNSGQKPVRIDKEIRAMAMVSLLAVFMDILPGYRIRPLTDAEKDVKVSQLVQRQREWEEGLLGVYKKFLENCEEEVKEETPLAPAALHCLCQLVQEKSDFNFAVNIMDVIVKRLGRKGWDEGHQLCLNAVVYIFRNDTTTTASNSLHLVRLISRLVRARSFAIRPEVLSALLNLRLKEELGGGRVRASADSIYREKEGRKGIVRWNKEKDHRGRKGGKAKAAMAKKGSKKTRAVAKEREAIEKEMREAEGEINQEERERNMTETLKLLFALYFRVIKLDYRSPLLPAALEGLARFAHLVNVDFFRDLLEVLKGIIKRGDVADEDGLEEEGYARRNDKRERLLCIVTAFELLQGQGEALNIDLGEFVSALYALILPLALSPTFEEIPFVGRNDLAAVNQATAKLAQTEADLLFRALAAVFLTPRTLPSPVRTLAFSKRLLTSSLNWPPASQLRTLGFLRSLLIREPKLEAMLETADRRIDGKWRGAVDEPERAEPEGTCWWEAGIYASHPDEKVKEEARKLGKAARMAFDPVLEILAPFLVGTFLNLVMLGVTLVQTSDYFKLFGPTDKRIYIWAVWILFWLGVLHTIASCSLVYESTVKHFGNGLNLFVIPWGFCVDPIITALQAGIVQTFYAYRVYIVSGRSLGIPAFLAVLTAAQLGFGLFCTVYAFHHPSFATISDITYAVASWLFLMAGGDIIITSSLIYYLSRAKSDFYQTNTILERVIRHTITNNALTAVTATVSSLMFMVGPGAWHVIAGLIIGKLYQISFLASLNARDDLKRDLAASRNHAAGPATTIKIPHTPLPNRSHLSNGGGGSGLGIAARLAPSFRSFGGGGGGHGQTSSSGGKSGKGGSSSVGLESFPIQIMVESSVSEFRIEEDAWDQRGAGFYAREARKSGLPAQGSDALGNGLMALPSPVFSTREEKDEGSGSGSESENGKVE
ncbi:nuclear export protein noc3 [Pseudohyphozyma bogoriensis]|nr:nuclear export protein noc3 [Pseudohyphozyma bogoriensis]